MVAYMKVHLSEVQCTCSVHFKTGNAKGERVMTDTSFVEFISSDVRDFVLKEVESNEEKHKFVI